jgi:hypothetical protein
MFDDVFNTQMIADQLKPMIREAGKGRADERRHAMQVLQSFERCSWHEPAFIDAMSQVEIGRFTAVDARNIRYDGDDALSAITQLLTTFIESVCSEELPSDRDKQDFSTAEAAAYLGVTEAAVRKHIYVTGELVGRKIGHSLVFSRDELDQFATQERRPGPGRPRKAQQS